MMLRKIVIGLGVACLLSAGVAVPSSRAAEKTGSIRGTISVRGVRNAGNVLVYVVKAPGDYSPPKEPVEVDQVKLTFVPHVIPIVRGTTVRFLNSDPILHNVFWPRSKSYSAKNLGTWGKGGSRNYTFNKIGEAILLCNVHPEMEAHVVVLQNPFFVVVGKDGDYKINGLPPGDYTVKTWYARPKKLRSKTASVTVKAGEATKLDFSLSRRR